MPDSWVIQGPNGEPSLIYFETDHTEFHAITVQPSGVTLDRHFPTKDIKAVVAWLGTLGYLSQTLSPYPFARGQRHSRIWRGDIVPLTQEESRALASTGTATSSLLRILEQTFYAIEPNAENAHTFGQKLRHLLILTCTEVEAAWKGIMRANGVKKKKIGTEDYVKLLPVLRLDEWKLALPFYPDYPEVLPFKGWLPDQPTKSLPWYDAYQAVKHDREESLGRATLENVISASAAMLTLAAAQFGWHYWSDPDLNIGLFAQTLFQFRAWPKWKPNERYFAPRAEAVGWDIISCRFK